MSKQQIEWHEPDEKMPAEFNDILLYYENEGKDDNCYVGYYRVGHCDNPCWKRGVAGQTMQEPNYWAYLKGPKQGEE